MHISPGSFPELQIVPSSWSKNPQAIFTLQVLHMHSIALPIGHATTWTHREAKTQVHNLDIFFTSRFTG